MNPPPQLETIVLGGGCFWCTEAIFERTPGVRSVRPGYAGGYTPDPTYESVCEGDTGHAEVIEVVFDPKELSLKNLLILFFKAHDATTLNRQGNDIGTQYRSTIYCPTDELCAEVENVIRLLMDEGVISDRITTERMKLETFYPAENYHHHYFQNNPDAAYCRYVIAPKVDSITHAT
jgi:peptide-methionine (S)-S-oxide reductase